ncbi:hemagglutinin repeat-containing protein [Caballeronia sp. RCC_10]|uniref:hemagglutinin repeat-containing protein n=1 Tax=Caballeronia sp. RCC_10 TaxID=3239227 RepID=UPI0035259E3A
MLIGAGHDLTVHGANIAAGGNAQITAGNNILVDTVQSNTSQTTTYRADRYANRESTINETSGISTGGSLGMQSGNDMTFKGAQVSAGTDMTVVAGGNLSASSVTDSAKVDDVYHSKKRSQEVHDYDEQAVGTNFSAGGNATLAAVATDKSKGNVTLTGSSLSADTGAANIVATGDVTLNEAREEHDRYYWEESTRGSVVKSTTTEQMQNTQANIGVGSIVSGDSVNVQSGKDVTIQGSNVVGTHDVKLNAVGDVTITTSQDTERSQSSYEQRESGFLSGMTLVNQLDGGLQGYSIGTRKTTDAEQATQVTNNGSMIGSLDGNLVVTSGNDLHVTGSTMHAGNDVSLTGKTVTIDAAQNASAQSEQQSFSQTGVTAGLSSPVLAAVQTANQMRQDVKRTKGDARLDALAAATTGLAGKNAYDAVASNPSQLGGIGVSVSLGTNHSHSSATQASTTAAGSTVSAGNDVHITATGAGANSNINIIGSDVTAGHDAALDAQGSINLQAAQNTDSMRSSNSGSSASIGATFSVGGAQNGLSFQAGASGTKGHGDGDGQTWTNTHVNAGGTTSLHSGGDTNLKGAVVDGQQVVADVGGNLNIESLQETSHYDSKQTSGGVSVSVCVPPICAGASSVSANFNQQKLNSDYASVTEQSGIQAGDGGFQLNVKGNTDLKGGVIASSDQAVAAASELNLYSRGDISNTHGANIFSLGDINIAGDATRDANGLLANRANTVTNDQSTIEAQGNIEVATNTLYNTRPAPTVETVTTGVETLFQTKRSKYMPCGTGGPDSHTSCTQEVWDDYYSKPRNDTFSAADVVSSTSGAGAVDRAVVVNINGTPTTLYYNTLTTNADGTVKAHRHCRWTHSRSRVNGSITTKANASARMASI